MSASAPDGAWRELIRELASFERPSASDGEKRAAELIARRLRELGYEPRIEEEPAPAERRRARGWRQRSRAVGRPRAREPLVPKAPPPPPLDLERGRRSR